MSEKKPIKLRNYSIQSLPTRFRGIISGESIKSKYHCPDISVIVNELRVRQYSPESAAILEFLERIFVYAKNPRFPFPNQGPLLAALANTILSYGYSTQSQAMEKVQLSNIWAPMVGVSIFSMIPEHSTLQQVSVPLEHVSPFDMAFLKKNTLFGGSGDNFYKTFGPQYARPLGTQLNLLVNNINALASYRNAQIPDPPLEDLVNAPLIPTFITPVRIYIAQHMEAVFEYRETFPDKLIMAYLLTPGERRKITEEVTTRAQTEEMNDQCIVDSTSERALNSLQVALEAKESEKTGAQYSENSTTNKSTDFTIGGHVNAKIKGIVDIGVNTNYNTKEGATTSVNNAINTENYAENCEKTVSDTVNEVNTARTMTVSQRKIQTNETTTKNVMEIEIENSSKVYAQLVETRQAAQYIDNFICASGFSYAISCGLETIYFEHIEELMEYINDTKDSEGKTVLDNIIEATKQFSLSLYNGQKIRPFVDGFKNPDEETADMIKYSLPLRKNTIKILLNSPYPVSKLLKGEDHLDDIQRKDAEYALRRLLIEMEARKMQILEQKAKIEFILRFVRSGALKNPSYAFNIAMALFNQSSIEGKMFMMEKNRHLDVDDDIQIPINEILPDDFDESFFDYLDKDLSDKDDESEE